MNHVINIDTHFIHDIPRCDLCIGYALQTAFMLMDHLPKKYQSECTAIQQMKLQSITSGCVYVECEMLGGLACKFDVLNTPEDNKGDNWYLGTDVDVLIREYTSHCIIRLSEG